MTLLSSPFRLFSWVAATAAVLACNRADLASVELESEPLAEDQLQLQELKAVDILFVIDNSGSMGEEQANLAANFGAFIDVLEANDVQADYRIGVTTTDTGNPLCPNTNPERGELVMSSCRDRIDEFVFADTVDVTDLACNDICTLDAAQLEIQPTATQDDPEPKPRPWLQRIEGHTNLPPGVAPADAFRCFGPQGVAGCGFESPLESMYLATSRFLNPGEASYGFMRPEALLAVVFVTDEVDCSYNADYAGVFTGELGTTFWSDPDAASPTSALCWNAGVECFGDPSQYDDCVATDYAVDGDWTSDPDAAVLHPLGRYLERLQSLEDDKKNLNPEADIIVAVLGGVGSDGSLVYADVTDSNPSFQADFGIGPGCTGEQGEAAVPPVRMRELAEWFGEGDEANLHSICEPDYTGALASIADRIRDQTQPACYGRCAADIAPETPALEVNCIVERTRSDGVVDEIPECRRDADGSYTVDPTSGLYVMPEDDEDTCFAVRTDPSEITADGLDDIAEACLDYGANVEFQIALAAGVVPSPGVRYEGSCVVSDQPEVDCPGL